MQEFLNSNYFNLLFMHELEYSAIQVRRIGSMTVALYQFGLILTCTNNYIVTIPDEEIK